MKRIAIVVAVVACGGTKAKPTESADARATSPTHDQCRMEKALDISRASEAIGPTCNRPAMPFTLSTFDYGVAEGMVEAEALVRISTTTCMCNLVRCGEQLLRELRSEVTYFQGKQARDASRLMETYASHSCLDSAIAAHVFRSGYNCGYLRAPRDQLRTATRTRFAAGGRSEAEADMCFDAIATSGR